MQAHSFRHDNATLAWFTLAELDSTLPTVIWGHGWGATHATLIVLAKIYPITANHILLDFPGFGASPTPPTHWNSKNYTDLVAALINDLNLAQIHYIGHSFGGRIGLQLARYYPAQINTLTLIAGHGIKPIRPLWRTLYLKAKVRVYKTLKFLTRFGLDEEKLKRRFGSPDYRNANPVLRKIMVNVVNEDLTAELAVIQCPTLLIYGAKDTETPPAMGLKIKDLIENAQFHMVADADHWSILDQQRYTVTKLIEHFIEEVSSR